MEAPAWTTAARMPPRWKSPAGQDPRVTRTSSMQIVQAERAWTASSAQHLTKRRVIVEPVTAPGSQQGSQFRPAILWGGLIAGISDISYAIIRSGTRGVSATRVLQSVASGLLGDAAYQGGIPTAIVGLGLHFMIATTIAAIYYAASRKLNFLLRWPIIFGPLYGLAVFLVMNRVVLPLSAVSFKISFTLLGAACHMFFVGLPIALSVWRFSRVSSSPALATT